LGAEDDAVYVGVIPATLGHALSALFATGRRALDPLLHGRHHRLLDFLAVDAYLEGTEIAESGTGAFGGAELLFIGAGAAYLGLVALDRFLRARGERAREAGASAFQLSLLIAIGIGLHNLGEGLAIGIRLRHR